MAKNTAMKYEEEGPHPIDIHVGGRVRMQRLLVGMTQTQLADTLGLTFQQVQKYEKGTNRISSSKLYEISGVLGVDPGFFFEDLPGHRGKERRKLAARTQEELMHVITTPDGIDLLRSFGRITNKEIRQKIVSLTRTISQQGEFFDE